MGKRCGGWSPNRHAGHRGEIAGRQTRRAGGDETGGGCGDELSPPQSPGRSPPVRESWMELTHHPPPANLAAPEDGRSPDLLGSRGWGGGAAWLPTMSEHEQTPHQVGPQPACRAQGGRSLDGKPEGPGGDEAVAGCGDEPSPPQSPGRSPPVRGSWMELAQHPPPANLAAPEDGRTPDFVGSLVTGAGGLHIDWTLPRILLIVAQTSGRLARPDQPNSALNWQKHDRSAI